MLLPVAGGSGTVVSLGELMMILELHRQGLTVSAIARQLGIDRKTVAKYIARGLEPPAYGPRPPRARARSDTCISSDIDMCRSSKSAPNFTPHAWLRKALPRRRLHSTPYPCGSASNWDPLALHA